MYVCLCHGVTERQIVAAIDSGVDCMKQLRRDLGIATECGRCASCASDCLKQTLASRNSAEGGAK
ncbi:(2Fe-2S)-binding protein [Haliea sp. E17]|uniref:(2Fe-2S)-binding protein n=1 Tax=Haliea sp. E17 TaxID=3401576 RepID=UPI003AB04451